MANEAVLRTRFSNPVDFTCYDDTPMEKGTIVWLSGARIVFPTSTDNQAVIGVVAREKIAGDGRTQVAVYLDGIFDILCQDVAIGIGEDLSVSGANVLKKYTTLDDEKGYILGKALEATTNGTIQVLLNKR